MGRVDRKPKQDFDNIRQLGLKAYALAMKHEAALGQRVTPAFLADFENQVTALNDAVPATMATYDGSVQLTAAQKAVLGTGYRLIKGVRITVRGQRPGKDVLLAYGVGSRTSSLLVKDIKNGLQTILDRVAAMPAEAARFRIVDEDVMAMKASLSAINAIDQAHSMARAATPFATKQRNAMARQVLAGVKLIAGAGMRAHVNDATISAAFEALTRKAT